MMQLTDTETADRLFNRAKEIIAECHDRQERHGETPRESMQSLAFRIAELEHADTKDEYSTD